MADSTSTKTKAPAKAAAKKASPRKRAAKKSPSKKTAPKASASKRTHAPVTVNQFTQRSDEDPVLGQWVDIVSGEYEGRRAAYLQDLEHDRQTGYPSVVLVRTRDADNLSVPVKYTDIRPSAYTGGR